MIVPFYSLFAFSFQIGQYWQKMNVLSCEFVVPAMSGGWRGNRFRQGSYFSKNRNNKPWPQTLMEIIFLNMMHHKDICSIVKGYQERSQCSRKQSLSLRILHTEPLGTIEVHQQNLSPFGLLQSES